MLVLKAINSPSTRIPRRFPGAEHSTCPKTSALQNPRKKSDATIERGRVFIMPIAFLVN